MMMRNIVISLGITTLSSLLLYMYFRNKMSNIVFKHLLRNSFFQDLNTNDDRSPGHPCPAGVL